jgi:pyridoxine 5-phosphate synthase
MLKLGVNIDHVATVRQARGTDYPDPLEAARLCLDAGAHGITVHLREDRRHIQDADVRAIKVWGGLPLNLEMGHSEEIVAIAHDVRPAEVCIVPEKRRELTTEGGLDAAGRKAALRPTIAGFRTAGIAVSLFIEADRRQIEAAADLGAPFIELHTGRYCSSVGEAAREELKRLIDGARAAHKLGLRVNAGHGIHLANVDGILRLPHLEVLNIGHSIVARALSVGMKAAVAEMLARMASYAGGEP